MSSKPGVVAGELVNVLIIGIAVNVLLTTGEELKGAVPGNPMDVEEAEGVFTLGPEIV